MLSTPAFTSTEMPNAVKGVHGGLQITLRSVVRAAQDGKVFSANTSAFAAGLGKFPD